MFTGLVTAIGTVRAVKRSAGGVSLTIAAPYRGLKVGESIAVDGVCLSVMRRRRGEFLVTAVKTTRSRTTIGEWTAGRRVNLERALRAGDRLGGHLVSGHVDGVGTLIRVDGADDDLVVDVRVPAGVAALTVPHGSIAVDGVSLTVSEIPKPGVVRVALIPHTLARTTLGGAVPGRRVHLEADQVARLVSQFLKPHSARGRGKA
jgi:riboflavin synthase